LLAFTVNEEHGFSGATALAKAWQSSEPHELRTLIPRPPDAAIVSEPTLLSVVAAHKGMVRWRCHTHGVAGHSSQPERAENAIYRMASVLQHLEVYAREVVPTLAEHPLVGRPTLSVGTIHGGVSVNTVPDGCTIEIDRRIVPVAGESPAAARQHVIDYLAEHLPAAVRVSHASSYLHSPGLTSDRNQSLAQALQQVARGVFREAEVMGVSYGTNAHAYDHTGVPTVVFGPGSIAQAHTCDEWVDVTQLEAASEIYFQFARGF
jgi:acetylornithine deacetylase